MRRPRVLITSGDPGGIGPELVLRALADPGTGSLADFTAVGAPASAGTGKGMSCCAVTIWVIADLKRLKTSVQASKLPALNIATTFSPISLASL